MKNIIRILAIETSCDETAAAVVESSRLPLTANRFNENNIKNTKQADSGERGAECRILSNIVSSQIKIHQKYGGVFPEHASRAHTEKMIEVAKKAIQLSAFSNQLNGKLINNHQPAVSCKQLADCFDLIAVTVGPGLIGSLLVGINFAKTLAYTTNKPIIGINHWLGHIYSNFVGEIRNPKSEFLNKSQIQNSKLSILDKAEGSHRESGGRASASRLVREPETSVATRGLNIPQFPALVLIASGGHTGLVLMKSHTEIQTLGETLDDAAGEAFDKVAKLLGLGYPGGPAISAAAAKFKIQNSKFKIDSKFKINNLKFPRSMLDRKDYNFSFSGLKTAVLYKVKELTKRYPLNAIRSLVAYEFQQAVIDILIGKTIQAAKEFKPKSICLCGGVSANQELRNQMAQAVMSFQRKLESSKISFHIPPMELTGDNAAMIGIAASYHLDQKTTYSKIQAEANLEL